MSKQDKGTAMSTDLITRLRDDYQKTVELCAEAAEEIERLKVLLKEAADELGTIADMAYPDRNDYPDEMLRYKRDMDLPNRIDEATRERRGRGGAGVKERELVASYRIWEHINGCDNFELADRITQYRRDAVAEKDKEIERLTKQWDTACAAAEDHHEFVLAQINAGLKEEIERLKAENSCMTSACKMLGCQDREPDR